MGFSAPDPPPPAPAPTILDPAVEDMKARIRLMNARRKGYSSTFITGGRGLVSSLKNPAARGAAQAAKPASILG